VSKQFCERGGVMEVVEALMRGNIEARNTRTSGHVDGGALQVGVIVSLRGEEIE